MQGKFVFVSFVDEGAISVYLQGKEWVDAVRKCLMKKLAPSYKRGSDCAQIKRKAFATHVGCYVNSGIGFCKMLLTNKVALYKVYEFKDFGGKGSLAALWQVRINLLLLINYQCTNCRSYYAFI